MAVDRDRGHVVRSASGQGVGSPQQEQLLFVGIHNHRVEIRWELGIPPSPQHDTAPRRRNARQPKRDPRTCTNAASS